MHKKNKIKALVAIAVALAFVMPVAAFANVGTIGVTPNSENTSDMENMVETSINSDNSDNTETASNDNYDLDYTEDTIVAEKTIDNAMPAGNTVYVDDSRPPEWYNETQFKTIREAVTAALFYFFNQQFNI